jgi:hypothetical protein
MNQHPHTRRYYYHDKIPKINLNYFQTLHNIFWGLNVPTKRSSTLKQKVNVPTCGMLVHPSAWWLLGSLCTPTLPTYLPTISLVLTFELVCFDLFSLFIMKRAKQTNKWENKDWYYGKKNPKIHLKLFLNIII